MSGGWHVGEGGSYVLYKGVGHGVSIDSEKSVLRPRGATMGVL